MNHYHEAANIIQVLEGELTVLKTQLGLSDEDFEKFYEQEKEYFMNFKSIGNPLSMLKRQYVKALNDLAHWQYVNLFFPSLVTLRICRIGANLPAPERQQVAFLILSQLKISTFVSLRRRIG